MESTHTTTGFAAVRIGGGVQRHHIDKLANRNLIPYTRAGRTRLIALSDLDHIREVCRAKGYYRAETQTAVGA